MNELNENLTWLHATIEQARREIGKVIIGQEETVERALIVILCRQHALIEGVPGIAKTLLVRTMGRVLGCEFARIQFTPDLMPSDISGTNIFNMRTGEFTLMKGPVFTSFLLADEINRAPAKTQSALLQAMQERLVSIDRATWPLPENFTVFATQNPIEYEGVYPLPEAQKDRFMLKIIMGMPGRDDEMELARRMLGTASPEERLAQGDVQAVLPPDGLARIRQILDTITVREELVGYMVDLVRATRSHPAILSGAGPRAMQSLVLASRASAALRGRDFVTPEDVRDLAAAVLGHRLVLRPEHEIEGLAVEEVIGQLLAEVPVPR
jgi:MoxR-like ATPase